jgi:hypothetical protein
MLIFVVARTRLDRYPELRQQFHAWHDVMVELIVGVGLPPQELDQPVGSRKVWMAVRDRSLARLFPVEGR